MPYIRVQIEFERDVAERRFFAPSIDPDAYFKACRDAAGETAEADPDAPRCPECNLDLSEFRHNGQELRYCPLCGCHLSLHFPSCDGCGLVFLRPLDPNRRRCTVCGAPLAETVAQ